MKAAKSVSKNNLFPTMVYSVENVLGEADRLALLADIRRRPEQQSHPDLFHESAYQPLITEIAELARGWMQDHHWEYEKLTLTGMWFTKLDAGGYHRPHSHGNNLISGVYYPEHCASEGIVFEDPRYQAHVVSPYAINPNPLNSPSWSFPTTQNSLLLFPSWLKHHVPPASTSRVSIAFNLMVTGFVGREAELQAAEFS